ncbi:uncharacterized protein A1O9_06636 [Exophiala aquamarina CBS 119918]|uniref:Arb2 domain-containing protein n=1 Tax=Exophiala aquamarina CBS 119918 TaxID=1182545 RepID=A0A072PT68_9EURO|nr:uncharacterized protein A1O9_06636 [Exophiala aquamarina CBS 119918]KEF58710.1 hypothetical protein A1O9_06636 [Exophiala aquamarina CBS 119918]
MFRRLPQTLPADPSFPADLAQLGFFVNDNDQIRQIKNPAQKFQYKMNANERVNQAYKFASNLATRKIILDRLHALGLETVRLPLGAGPTDKHVPILVSKDIGSKDRVVVFLGERQMEPGVLSWRVIGDTGIRHGSMVDFVDAALNGPTATAEQKSPGIVIANPCQLLWFRGGARAVSDGEWMDMPRPNGVSEALRQDKEVNRVEHNRDYSQHVQYIFSHVLRELVSKDAKIDVIGLEYAAGAALEYLAGHWSDWAGRITGICLANAQYKMEDLVQGGAPPEFVAFVSKRCRAYSVSPSPLEAPVSGRERLGCNCYASGEHDYHENVVVKAWRSMLDWFNILYANPGHEEVEFIYIEEGEDEQGKMVWSKEEAEAAIAEQVNGDDEGNGQR